MIKIELELIKYDYVDTQHHSLQPGCFGDITGKRVRICLAYDLRKVVATGTLFERDKAIWIAIDYLPEEFKGWEACASFCVDKMPLEDSPLGDYKRISKARLQDVVGLVPRGEKIH